VSSSGRSDQRRATDRHQVVVHAIAVTAYTHVRCTIENMSLGGVRVAMPMALGLPRDHTVRLRFFLPDIKQEIDNSAMVCWSERMALGLRFENLRTRERSAIDTYLSRLITRISP